VTNRFAPTGGCVEMSVEFVTREIIFDRNSVLAWHIFDWQKFNYDPAEHFVEAGEEIYLELSDEKPTVLSEKLAEEVNRQAISYSESMRDIFEQVPPRLKKYEIVIAELPIDELEVFMAQIGIKLKALCDHMNWSQIHIISDSRSPYLLQDNAYPPVKLAEKKLNDMGLEHDFSGGIILESTSIQEFFSPIFWIVRCNASAPYINFCAEGSKTVGVLCKYGNVHFEPYCEREKKQLLAAMGDTGFEESEDGCCYERFSEDSAMEGRKISLD